MGVCEIGASMLERAVRIDGVTYTGHDLVQMAFVRDQYIVATIRHTGRDVEPRELPYEIPFVDGMTFAEAEELCWELPELADDANASARLVEAEAGIQERDEIIERMAELLTPEQREQVLGTQVGKSGKGLLSGVLSRVKLGKEVA